MNEYTLFINHLRKLIDSKLVEPKKRKRKKKKNYGTIAT